MKAAVTATEFYLPEGLLTNEDLCREFPDWTPAKIQEKTGIESRRVVSAEQTSLDLAQQACRRLLDSGVVDPAEVDFVLLCTQSPDYFLPTSACILQHRLGLRTSCGALDFNLGCSGFVYGLGIAKGLIETGQARKIILVTAETYSKFLHPHDRSVRTIFGDGAAATLIEAVDVNPDCIGPFVYGTDGSGARNLIVPAGGMRDRSRNDSTAQKDEFGNERGPENLYMNGAEIFSFTLRSVPAAVQSLLQATAKTLDDFDVVVFHQANQYMLDQLRKKLKIPAERFYISMRTTGNTVSATIPIALCNAAKDGVLKNGATVMLVGFGVGYSWAATSITWNPLGKSVAHHDAASLPTPKVRQQV